MNKAVKVVLIVLVAVLLVGGVVYGVCRSAAGTPEYAMAQIVADVNESGLDGLRPHLTASAQETVDTVTAVTESNLVNTLLDLFSQTDYVGVLKSELQSIEWEVEDILTGEENASVILHFDYDGRLTGRIDITLLKEDGEWKIDGLSYPQFDTIDW